MRKPNRFQKLVADAKNRIKEISPADAWQQAEQTNAILIDVREKDDWEAGHIRNAIHLSRGIVELEIEERVPDVNKPIVCYCGGGSRAALVADSLQKMGYTNVHSIAGGFRDWKAASLPMA